MIDLGFEAVLYVLKRDVCRFNEGQCKQCVSHLVHGEGGSGDGHRWKAVEASRYSQKRKSLQLILSFKIRAPFIDGIGAVDRILERIVTGATGEGPTGYEVKIRQIYKVGSKFFVFLIRFTY